MIRFDCVFPTRTARFGVALITTGSIRLKAKEFAEQLTPVDAYCSCSTCQHYTCAALHAMLKENNPLAAQLLTKHNVSYMMRLMRTMRQSIMEGPEAFKTYVQRFLQLQFPGGDVPLWVVDALAVADIPVTTISTTATTAAESDSKIGSAAAGAADTVADGANHNDLSLRQRRKLRRKLANDEAAAAEVQDQGHDT